MDFFPRGRRNLSAGRSGSRVILRHSSEARSEILIGAGLINAFFAFMLETDSAPILQEVIPAHIKDITEEEIVSRIGKLMKGKARGPNEIPTEGCSTAKNCF